MPDNVTVNEAVGGDAAPPLSVSNWPGETAAATPPADPGKTDSDATPPPADSGTPPAATETPPAEGEGGEAGTGDTPPADGGEGGEPGEGAAGEGGEPPAAAKPDKSLSGRLSKATRERNEERERADQLAGLLEKAIEKLGGEPPAAAKPVEPGATETPPAVVEPPDPRPRRDAFDDPDAYDEAVDAWSVKQATRVVKAEIARQETERKAVEEQQRQRTAAQTYHAERVTSWNSQVAELKKSDDYADFDDLLVDTTVPIAAPVSAMLLTMPQGAKVFHHLGHHKTEAEEISKLALAGNHQEALRRLHRIEYQLETARPQVSKTPPPIKPLGNSSRAAPKAPEEMSMEEYAAARTPAIQAERKGAMFGNRRA